ncbi:MAG TPA: cytochrome c3 family protein [Candidatus Polarisedimenticolia bacterium]|nr:cytochrome c3 family protein [Candidatus Polarisedimenticolia bacterium]
MKRTVILLLAFVALLFASTSAQAQYSRIADIVGTDHNLSATGPGSIKAETQTQICFYCHVPHQVQDTTDPAVTSGPANQPPLWNHYLSAKASYGVYSSPSFDAMGTDISDLGGAVAGSAAVSNLCLSCHDGTVGVNTLYKGEYVSATGERQSPSFYDDTGAVSGPNVPVYMMADTQIGAGVYGLSSTHPLNFTYDAALAAKSISLQVPAVDTSGIGGARLGLTTSTGKFLPLFAGKMQCPSCHNVHSNANGRPFLRASTNGSELCLGCHGK